jgi:glycosyltransferase involved in cell wall biosynthesis
VITLNDDRPLRLARVLDAGSATLATPSRFLAGLYKREWGRTDIRVIRHGVRHGTLRRNERVYRNGDRLVFGCSGAASSPDGLLQVVVAFGRVTAPQAALEIHGGGGAAFAEVRVAAAGDGRIRFPESWPEAGLAGFDVLVLPSVGYGDTLRAVDEAAACGVPVIAAASDVSADLMLPGVSGLLFEPGDPARLAAILRELLSLPDCLNAFKRSLGHLPVLGVDQEAYAYGRVYTEIIAGRPARPASGT